MNLRVGTYLYTTMVKQQEEEEEEEILHNLRVVHSHTAIVASLITHGDDIDTVIFPHSLRQPFCKRYKHQQHSGKKYQINK